MNPQPAVIDTIVERLKGNPHVEQVILFGSRARGDERERSDIDLVVVGPEITDREWTQLWTYVDEEAPTLLSVDLVRWQEASAQIQESIRREGVVLYEREQAPAVHGRPRERPGGVERVMKQKFSSQADPKLLATMREIARQEGRPL